ncbi:MAG TPA: class I SAM-dependent methyltransferase [Syntrophales bacterium]|nr:class I SAM-dependent methyltransferase [Syntrophales bacterium]
MNPSQDNRFQNFFEDDKYIILKNYLYNYLLRKNAIEKSLRSEKWELILEVGSGISPIITGDDQVVYSDLSFLAMLTIKRSLAKGLYITADTMNLPFKEKSFSHVILSEVLEHVEDDRKALAEIARVTKEAGVLIITFPHRWFYFACDDRYVKHFRRYELAEMEDHLREAGLHPVSVSKVLGPLEKIIMCTAIFIFSMIRKFNLDRGVNTQMSKTSFIFSYLFKLLNRLLVVFAWLDAIIMPRALSTVLMIKAVKSK